MPVVRCSACNLVTGGKHLENESEGKLKTHRGKLSTVNIQFKEPFFSEIYEMKVHTGITVAELKGDIELLTGIPTTLQQLFFNDEAMLYDSLQLFDLSLVSNSTLFVTIRHDWAKIVEAVMQQDTAKLSFLGLTEDSIFSSPSIDYIKDSKKRGEALQFRGTVALMIASQRGYANLVKQLIDSGVNVNGQTQLRRSALHVVSAKGQSEILNILIHSGANIDLTDINGETPLDIANRLGQTQSSRQLFLFRWQLRAKNAQPSFADFPMFPHQYFDSDLTVHLNGTKGQVYMMHFPPTGEGDRWKPRKEHNYTRRFSPARITIEQQERQGKSAKVKPNESDAKESKPSMNFYSAVGSISSNKTRPKSPSFAYEDGNSPKLNKRERFLKKDGESSRPMSALSNRENRSKDNRQAIAIFGLTHQQETPIMTSPQGNKMPLPVKPRKSSAAPVTTRYNTPNTRSAINSSGQVRQDFNDKGALGTAININQQQIHEMAKTYKPFKSVSDTWTKIDLSKSGFTLLWA